MENPWLFVEDIDEPEEENGTFMGVFNRPPSEIARSLPRPLTPSINRIPQFIFDPSKIQNQISTQDSLESPMFDSHSPSSVTYGPQLVSVF